MRVEGDGKTTGNSSMSAGAQWAYGCRLPFQSGLSHYMYEPHEASPRAPHGECVRFAVAATCSVRVSVLLVSNTRS